MQIKSLKPKGNSDSFAKVDSIVVRKMNPQTHVELFPVVAVLKLWLEGIIVVLIELQSNHYL